MTQSNTTTTAWHPPLDAYDYMSRLAARDWAWEGLRRNPAYQSVAQSSMSGQSEILGGRVLLTRMQARMPPAEAWALCCFR